MLGFHVCHSRLNRRELEFFHQPEASRCSNSAAQTNDDQASLLLDAIGLVGEPKQKLHQSGGTEPCRCRNPLPSLRSFDMHSMTEVGAKAVRCATVRDFRSALLRRAVLRRALNLHRTIESLRRHAAKYERSCWARECLRRKWPVGKDDDLRSFRVRPERTCTMRSDGQPPPGECGISPIAESMLRSGGGRRRCPIPLIEHNP